MTRMLKKSPDFPDSVNICTDNIYLYFSTPDTKANRNTEYLKATPERKAAADLLEAIKKIMTISAHMKSDRAGDINKIAALAFAKTVGDE